MYMVHVGCKIMGMRCRASASTPFSVLGGILWISMLTVLLAAFPCELRSEPTAEVRGLWVVRDTITTEAQVVSVVDFAEDHGCNVLFVQIRGRGDSYYRSATAPCPEGYPHIPDEFDPLAAIIRHAHARSIEVHAWFNMYLTWSSETNPTDPNHPLNAHPEWFMVSLDGSSMATCPISEVVNDTSEGRYLSPVLEPVRGYLSYLITEIMIAYDVDGIHLDYVRYPGRAYDFHPVVRSAFQQRFGVDPVPIVRGDEGTDPSFRHLGHWVSYRSEFIDVQVRSIKRRIKLVDPRVRFSAAVKPHADEAYFQYGQNWVRWLGEDIMDFVVTMSYYDDTTQFREVMLHNLDTIDPARIVGGVGTYKISSDEAVRQVSLTRELGLLGHCHFSYTTFRDDPSYARSFESFYEAGTPSLPESFNPYIRGGRSGRP